MPERLPFSLSQLLWMRRQRGADPGPVSGLCSACGGGDSEFAAVADVTSPNFTDWDRLSRDGDGLCRACVWSLREKSLRKLPQIAGDVDGVVVDADWGVLRSRLSRPVGAGDVVSVPFGGRKHLVMFARPGFLSTDWGLLPWRGEHVELLDAVEVLRASGMSEGEMASGESLPPLGAGVDGAAVLSAFGLVRAWRRTPLLNVALRVTRPVKGEVL